MLWDLIFDFYIVHIFGGYTTQGIYHVALIGYGFSGGTDVTLGTGNVVTIGVQDLWGGTQYLPLGNYLSLIATIITLVIILLVIGHFIKKTFNLFGRII